MKKIKERPARTGTKPIVSSRFLSFVPEEGYELAKKLAEKLGKEVVSSYAVDKGTKQYLVGLEYATGIEGWSRYWAAKIRFVSNGNIQERWIDVRAVRV
jgi:hypothetical protein